MASNGTAPTAGDSDDWSFIRNFFKHVLMFVLVLVGVVIIVIASFMTIAFIIGCVGIFRNLSKQGPARANHGKPMLVRASDMGDEELAELLPIAEDQDVDVDEDARLSGRLRTPAWHASLSTKT